MNNSFINVGWGITTFLQMLMNVKMVTMTVMVQQTFNATILLEALFVYVQLDINWLKAIV